MKTSESFDVLLQSLLRLNSMLHDSKFVRFEIAAEARSAVDSALNILESGNGENKSMPAIKLPKACYQDEIRILTEVKSAITAAGYEYEVEQ